MLTILFIVSCALTILFFKKKRDLKNQGRDKEMLYYFSSNSLDFFAPFTLVLLFYAGLLTYITILPESTSLESLIGLEESLTKLKTFFKDHIKLSAQKVFILIAFCYLLSLLRVSFKKTYRPVSKVNRWLRRVYIAFALLCSFTLFGAQPGAPTDDLQFRIKTIRDGYADVYQQVQETISEEVANSLYAKVHDSFPSDYQQALKLPEEIGKQSVPLQKYYESVRREHGIKLDEVESALGILSSQREAASKLSTEISITEEAASKLGREIRTTQEATAKPNTERRIIEEAYSKNLPVDEQVPPQISYKQVKEAKTAIENYRQSTQSRVITFLNTWEGKKLTLRLQKVFTSNLRNALFSSWVEAYPVLGPIIDQFVTANVDNELQARGEKAVSKAAEAITRNPGGTQKIITNTASELVEQTVVKPSAANLENANNTVKQVNNDLANIERCKAQIGAEVKRVESQKINMLINQLRSPNEAARESAARDLSRMGEKISQAQVNQLVNIMRRGNQTWSKFLYRESHCRWFEYTSAKYYAADALASMRSPHVSSEIAREAQTCRSNSKTRKRVMDPGWI